MSLGLVTHRCSMAADLLPQGQLFAGTSNLVAVRWLMVLGANAKAGAAPWAPWAPRVWTQHHEAVKRWNAKSGGSEWAVLKEE